MDDVNGVEETVGREPEQCRPPVIIASIGTSKYQRAINNLNGKEVECRFIQIALAKFFGASKLCLLATEEAERMQKSEIEREAREHELDLSIEWHRIPDGTTEEHQWEIFGTLVKAVEAAADSPIIIDITHAFRSIPLLVLLGITFLRAMRKVNIVGMYYGQLNQEKTHSRIISLSEALYLQKWVEAARDFMKYGDSSAVGELLKEIQDEAHRSEQHENAPRKLITLGKALNLISATMMVGQVRDLPRVAEYLKRYMDGELAEQITREAVHAAEPLKLFLGPMRDVYLRMATGDHFEVGRAVVDWHVDHGNYVVALQLMRELIVTKVGKVSFPDADESLLFDSEWRQRNPEVILWRLREACERKAVPKETAAGELGGAWSRISQFRNQLSHCGMNDYEEPSEADNATAKAWKKDLFVERMAKRASDAVDSFRRLFSQWSDDKWIEALLPYRFEAGDAPEEPSDDLSSEVRKGDGVSTGGGEGAETDPTSEKNRVLITPVGLSSGLLYTALKRVDPSTAMVVCSDATKPGAQHAAEVAGFSGELGFVRMDEPFTGFGEARKVLGDVVEFFEREGLRPDQTEVWVNLTGGTTAMQYVVNYVGQRLKRDGYEMRYVAMVDRRPHEQQVSEPFVVGEMILCPEDGLGDEEIGTD